MSSLIYHVRITSDQYGNEATAKEIADAQAKFDDAVRISRRRQTPPVVVTSDRVRVDLIPADK